MKIVSSTLQKLVFAGAVCLVLPVMAQAPVSDISTSGSRVQVTEAYGSESGTYGDSSDTRPAVVVGSEDSGGSEAGSQFRKMQQLQEEVATLRGQLEEQAYEIQKLKQQHQDDFANLDRRLAGGAAPVAAAAGSGADAGYSAPSTTGSMATAGNMDGKEEYEAAYAQLKAKDYNSASAAFKNFVNKYPNSDFAGNSWFWLGFIYQTQGDINSAASSFSSLVQRFPNHSKTDDARYNLGKIYHQQGKNDEARSLLKEVATGSSKSAPLAKSYLETM